MITIKNEEMFTQKQTSFILQNIVPKFNLRDLSIDFLNAYLTPLKTPITIITVDTFDKLHVFEFNEDSGYINEI